MKLLLSLFVFLSFAAAQPVRVGVFQRDAVVVAYYGSPLWASVLKAKTAERDKARQENDTKKVQELESWGQAQQELAHRQLAGEAPLTSILQALAPAFEDIKKKQNLARAAGEAPYAASGVQAVDITPQLLDWLQADERTRKIIAELEKKR